MNKDWLDIVILEDYLDGKLDPRTMNRVEREALEDPFVAEALAGLSASPKKSLESISLLQKQLQERIAEQQHTKKTALITWQRLSIAATAAVLFISVGIIFWMKQNNYQDMLAKQAKQPKEVEVTIASKELKDSLIKAQTQVAAAKPPKAETPKAEKSPSRAMEEAIKAAKTSAYASTAKAKMKSISTANPSPVAASSVDISSAALARTVIKGKVLDEASGQPLGNAAIYVKGTSIRTFTNNAGEFSVTSDSLPKNPEITAAYIGYENAIAQAKVNESNVLVLKENKTALNEDVVR
ncbi:MAG TPA: carboxypeptidase-like regulatory domain-containing protein, partial [Pedobacter sp.]|uniref:carboxypeptidase-like regulatory domain-containing protein n=1 Tax=Pedobacter sp. TaxID=1411316 RepID=UPI002BDAF74A